MNSGTVGPRGVLGRARALAAGFVRAVEALDRFTRIHFVGYTSLWPLLGAATADGELRPRTLGGVLGLSLLFHFYGGILNDVADLEIDRTQPARSRDPLVRGTVARSSALAFALVQIPLGFLYTAWLGLDPRAYLLLAGAFAAMAVYDLWSKRCPVPPMVEVAQSLAWVSLVFYGAELTRQPANVLTYLVALYSIAYTLVMNGVHGGLRDLENDYGRGARTTAIFLGMRPAIGGDARVPRGARVYCLSTQAVLAVLGIVPLSPWGAGYEGGTWWVVFALVMAANVLNFRLMERVLKTSEPGWDSVFRFHMFSMLLPLLLSLSAWPRPWLAVAIPTILLVPMLLIEHVRCMPRRALGRLRLDPAVHGFHRSAKSRRSAPS